jgi:hypothetical protein
MQKRTKPLALNYGDILELNIEEEALYAICTWTTREDDSDPEFGRGILLAEARSLKPHADKVGFHLSVTVDGDEYYVFPWLDAPLFQHRVVKVLGSVSKEMANTIHEYSHPLKEWTEEEKGHPALEDALVGWMNHMLMGDMFEHLDGLGLLEDEDENN